MKDDKRISIKEAAEYIAKERGCTFKEAERIIEIAWKEGRIKLYGIPIKAEEVKKK